MSKWRLWTLWLAAFAGTAFPVPELPPSLRPPEKKEEVKEEEKPNIGQLFDWVRSSNQADIRDGMFYVDAMSARAPIYVFRRDKTFADPKVTLQFKTEAVGTGERAVGLIFGSTSGADYYSVEVDRKNVTLYRVRPNQGRQELDRRGGFTRKDDTWYQVGIECQGTLVRVFFDNKFLFAFNAPQLQPGNVGFYTGDGRAWVRRLDFEGKSTRLPQAWKLQ